MLSLFKVWSCDYLYFTFTIFAGCECDEDCPVDRICEDGLCCQPHKGITFDTINPILFGGANIYIYIHIYIYNASISVLSYTS